jgi:hypothetical protein
MVQPVTGDTRQSAVLAGMARVIVIAETLVLAGCTSVDRAFHTVTDPLHRAFTVARYAVPAKVSPRPSAARSSGRPDNTPETPPPAVPEPALVAVDGLSGNAVRALLGQPATRGRHAPGETWTYRSGSCEVDLFLFPDVTNGGLRVLDHRVSGAGSEQDAQQACIRRLRDDHSA